MPIRKLLLASLFLVVAAGCSANRPQAVPVPAGPLPALAASGPVQTPEAGPSATNPPATLLPPTLEAGTARALAHANLRSGPGTAYPVTGQVEAGELIAIVACNSGRTWYQLADGSWIAAELVENAPRALQVALEIPTPPPPSPSPISTSTRTPTAAARATSRPAPTATALAKIAPTAVLTPTVVSGAGQSANTGLCPAWERLPRPGYAMLLVENHHKEPISLTAAGGATWNIPGKTGDMPGRWYAELPTGRHDFSFDGPHNSSVTPGRFTAAVEAGASYIVPLWDNGGGQYYVYRVEVPANCK